jgi:branched-chain amino acid transport system permease protein
LDLLDPLPESQSDVATWGFSLPHPLSSVSELIFQPSIPSFQYILSLLFLAAGFGSALVAPAWESLSTPVEAFLVVGTLAFLLICDLVSRNWTSVTRGPMGLRASSPSVPHPRTSGDCHHLESIPLLLHPHLVCLVLSFCETHHSRLGRAFRSIRDDEVLAKSMGVHTSKYKWLAFTISSFMAGIAGSYYAHYILFVDPLIFDLYYLEVTLITVIVGGAGTIWGVVAGAFIFTILPEFLRLAGGLRLVIYGIILLLSIHLIPDGIGGIINNGLKRRRLAKA